jgi:hypothetical protein
MPVVTGLTPPLWQRLGASQAAQRSRDGGTHQRRVKARERWNSSQKPSAAGNMTFYVLAAEAAIRRSTEPVMHALTLDPPTAARC